jgi:hypothetical protein
MYRRHALSLDLAEVESRGFAGSKERGEKYLPTPHTQREQVCTEDFIREALDKFIVSHAAEFMPVIFRQ